MRSLRISNELRTFVTARLRQERQGANDAKKINSFLGVPGFLAALALKPQREGCHQAQV